jgi:hypothetical protein
VPRPARRTHRCGAAKRVRLRLRAWKPGQGSHAGGCRLRRGLGWRSATSCAGTSRRRRPPVPAHRKSACCPSPDTPSAAAVSYRADRRARHLVQNDGKTREIFSIGSSEHFALPRIRRQAGGTDSTSVQAPLTRWASISAGPAASPGSFTTAWRSPYRWTAGQVGRGPRWLRRADVSAARIVASGLGSSDERRRYVRPPASFLSPKLPSL